MSTKESEKKQTNPWWFALQIGFFGGIIWGGLRLVFYYFEFTKVLPGFMVEPFFRHPFLKSTLGLYMGWGFFIIFSLLAALIYVALFRKLRGPWPGIIYGIAWWVICFVAVGPYAGMTKRITSLDLNSILTEGCVFLLWGMFVGYSINFEFTEERSAS